MTLILLAVSLSIALTMIAWHFAVYALPFMVGLAAFRYVHAVDAGIAMSIVAALGAAGLSVLVAAAVLAFVRAPLLRLPVLVLFAAPAALAGYAVVHGVAQNVIESTVALNLLCGTGGLFVGIAALLNISAHAAAFTPR
ncbi:hypothetical protein D5400_00735 [Georhizobium profundi]|jgi:hypothetical protein|uniref:DUF4175 domain-containing protein n=2 Tax=Hyphomicrobiales TaxID=356 RepID=A0A3S9AZ60_9HYPH|nr:MULTISPECIES: hypothetical protein [Hyphomicrobiales]AZN69990.1 hypothetical protein D5400_00735 [Georhizobium profundi]MCO6389963.1 hypothetical protein [Aliihoeflea aestuarii]MDF1599038.1 hypothetical protein [Mesorhizobium sp. YIM 152430]TYR29483.1 hypothetical protein FY036_21685 [Mesorhizobium microcysteis]